MKFDDDDDDDDDEEEDMTRNKNDVTMISMRMMTI